MQTVTRSLFPGKFLCLLGHIAMIIVIYFVKEDNIFAGIPYSAEKDDSDYKDAKDSLLAALSLSILLMLCELIVLLFGVTMQYAVVSIVSITFHSLGLVFLIWYFLLSWRYQVIWAIWALTNFVPLSTELYALIYFKTFVNAKN